MYQFFQESWGVLTQRTQTPMAPEDPLPDLDVLFVEASLTYPGHEHYKKTAARQGWWVRRVNFLAQWRQLSWEFMLIHCQIILIFYIYLYPTKEEARKLIFHTLRQQTGWRNKIPHPLGWQWIWWQTYFLCQPIDEWGKENKVRLKRKKSHSRLIWHKYAGEQQRLWRFLPQKATNLMAVLLPFWN